MEEVYDYQENWGKMYRKRTKEWSQHCMYKPIRRMRVIQKEAFEFILG